MPGGRIAGSRFPPCDSWKPEPGTAKKGYQPCTLAKEYEYKKNAGLCVLNPDALIVKLLSPIAEELEFMLAVFDIVFRG